MQFLWQYSPVHKASFLRPASSGLFWVDLSKRSSVLQAVEALDVSGEANVIFAGDLNWLLVDDTLPLTDGWCADESLPLLLGLLMMRESDLGLG